MYSENVCQKCPTTRWAFLRGPGVCDSKVMGRVLVTRSPSPRVRAVRLQLEESVRSNLEASKGARTAEQDTKAQKRHYSNAEAS